MVCTPGGRVSRYLYGIEYKPQTLRLALVEAGEGKVGSTTDRILLLCVTYDAASGSYAAAANKLMAIGGGLTVLVLGMRFGWRGAARPGKKHDVDRTREEVADVRSPGFSRNPGQEPPKGGTTNGTFLAAGDVTTSLRTRTAVEHDGISLGSHNRFRVGLAGHPDGRHLLAAAAVPSTAKYVDGAFYFILHLSMFFFFLIVALMVLFVIRYRRRPGFDPGESPDHNTPLEIFWSVIPLGLVIGIFYYSFIGYLWLRTAPRNPAYEIYVTGQKWTWSFKYPNGYVDPNLHVPVDESVKLTMQSQDVIHSLFIPAFRVKMDVVPGRYTTTWFKAIEVGEYDLECTEYCGTGHSDMLAKVIVHPSEDDYKNWLRKMDEDQQKLSPVDAGRAIVTRLCSVCHTVDGTAKIGPSFKGIWGGNAHLQQRIAHPRGRELHSRIDPGALQENPRRVSRPHAHVQGAAHRSADHQHHRLRQDFEIGHSWRTLSSIPPRRFGLRPAPSPRRTTT